MSSTKKMMMTKKQVEEQGKQEKGKQEDIEGYVLTKQQMEAEKVLQEMEEERVVVVPGTVITWLEKMVMNEKEETVKALSGRYNFDLADARAWLGLKMVKVQGKQGDKKEGGVKKEGDKKR